MKPALLVVDVQKVYTNPASELFCPDSAATLDRINALIGRFQQTGDLIVYVRHVHKADGTDLGRMFDFSGDWSGEFNFKEGAEEVEYDDRLIISPANALEITKTRYSCFAKTQLSPELESRGIDSVVVCGFMTNFCCESTARDAHDRDYYVDFIVDATGNPGLPAMNEETVRNAVAAFMQAGFARVATAKERIELYVDSPQLAAPPRIEAVTTTARADLGMETRSSPSVTHSISNRSPSGRISRMSASVKLKG